MKYSASALTTAAELSAKYINDRHLPDKAIDVIDEAGAAQRILPKSKQKKVIGNKEIEDIIAKIARIPPKNITADDRSALKTLERDLKAVVFGQDKAIEALTSAVKMARSGLGGNNKPVGSFLFSGPTGVGKTEVAKQLAYIMGIELIPVSYTHLDVYKRQALHNFALALTIGILFGIYSSVLVASPIAMYLGVSRANLIGDTEKKPEANEATP